MPVVTIPTPLRPLTGGLDRVPAEGTNVLEALNDVSKRHPGLRERIFDGDELRRHVNVYVNNEDIRFLDELDTKVAENDEIGIIPAIAGG